MTSDLDTMIDDAAAESFEAWKAHRDTDRGPAATRSFPPCEPPANVDPETGEIVDPPRPPLDPAFWESHPQLIVIRQAAHARGRAPTAVLGCVLARVCAELEHVYVLPPIVGSNGSLNLAVSLVGPSGAGKSTSDAIADELVDFTGTVVTRPRGLPLGSGEGVPEAYMGTRAATDDEKAAGLAMQGKIREQRRWNELFIGDEGQAVLAHGKRSGATLLPTLRTLVTGGPLGQQNAATDNRRIIPAGNYRAAVLLGFQTATAVELLDESYGGTPQRFVFVAATDPTIPDPDDRPAWPGPLTVTMPSTAWRERCERAHGGHRIVPVCDTARAEIVDADHRRQTGVDVEQMNAHRTFVREKVAAVLGVVLDGHPAVTDQTWSLAGDLLDHSDHVIAGITAHATAERRRCEQDTTERLAARAVRASERTEEWRTVEAAKRIAAKVRAQPGVTRSALRGELRRWRTEFEDGVTHAVVKGWILTRTEPGQGTDKHALHPGEARP